MNQKNQVKNFSILFAFLFSGLIFVPQKSLAFPIYAQQAYQNPREANGRIICANCGKPNEECYC